jgi:D-lactate dehydrogenase
MKVFVFSAHPYAVPSLSKHAEGKHELIFSDQKLSAATAHLAKGCEAVALFTADDASAPVIQKLSQFGIKFIALRSAGYDHVDLKQANVCAMRVANVPAYSPYAIAEHAAALLLAFNRKISEAESLIKNQDFRLDTLTGFDLHGKTVGIIGTGTIGLCFARIMKGFGCQILGTDPVRNPEAVDLGVRYVPLEELLAKSDVVSLHCPLNEKTKYLISAPRLAMMKKGSILINTARGGVVNTSELLESIEHGHLGGACLDVYENEKLIFFEDHRNTQIKDPLLARLLTNKKVLLTGHQAFLTVEALQGIAETTIKNLDYWEDGEDAPHELFKVKSIANS